tara:strand:- start:14236 stop:17292 length:3057 start_codon:yes stop_codon:yes gene_type:complete
MSNQSELETVLGNRNYSLESAANGLGSQISLRLLGKRRLVLPPQIKSATDKANIHYGGMRGVEEFAYANGIISEAESFIQNWPVRRANFRYAESAWSNSGVDVELMGKATPEWVALTNMISLTEEYQKTLDEDIKQERLAVYQRWWGLVAPPNPEKYASIGKAVTDEISDPAIDEFSGFGRPYAHQYYPSATQAFLANQVELLKVKHLTENKKGRITSIKTVDGSVVVYATQCPYTVDVQWEDGSTETLSYFQVRHLDPVIGEPMYCRAQQNLSPVDYFGQPVVENDFVTKLASVLVLASMDIGFAHTTLSSDNIVRKWTNLASAMVQPAARSITYNKMEDLNAPQKTVGWATDRGQRLMADIWNIFASGAGINNIGEKVKQFMDKIIVLPLGTVKDSGLVLCPHCKKCEPINTAEFVDFGIQTNDEDGFSSIKWQTRKVDGEQKFKAVGVVKCSGCSSLYFRRFNPSIRPFDNQIPMEATGGVRADSKPNLFLDLSMQGGTAAEATIMGYTFLPRFRRGSDGADGLPILRVFGELEGKDGAKQVRADDIPLEVGTQSRNLKKKRWCSGQTPISPLSSMTSHEWYDKNLRGGTGTYAGDNYENYDASLRTGMMRCSWCESVTNRINRYMTETWITGKGTFNFYSNESKRNFLELLSAKENDIFDTARLDYEAIGGETIDLGDGFMLEKPEKVLYYKIRMKGSDGLIKVLEIPPDDLGQEIPALDASPSIILKPYGVVCPNEDKAFLTPYQAFFEDYLEQEQKELNQESRFLVTEQLAYSAKLNKGTKKWEAKTPPTSYLNQKSNIEGLFNSAGTPSQKWTDGNRPSITPQGEKPRFPEPKMGLGTAATIITPYADNRMERPLKHYHIMTQVGEDVETTIDEESGRPITTTTPYHYCSQCNESFHGAPTNEDANIWKFPEPVGNEVFKNGWDIDPKTNALVFNEADVETERRDDGGGGYSPESDWHWTLPLYTENKPFGTWLDNALINNANRVKDLNFTQNMMSWLKNNKTFAEVKKDE